MTTALTTHQAVDDKVIQEYLFTSGTKLDEKQQALFLNIAKAFNLNPFKREIYPVAYENRKTGKIDLSIVTGYQVYLARADATGKLNGWHCTALYSEQAVKDSKGNETSHRRLDGAKIVIYRKDFDQPFEWEVSFRDFAKMYDGQLTGQWRQMPEFMIKKVCIGQGFRLAFPNELGGMPYLAEEITNEREDQLFQEEPKLETTEKPEEVANA